MPGAPEVEYVVKHVLFLPFDEVLHSYSKFERGIQKMGQPFQQKLRDAWDLQDEKLQMFLCDCAAKGFFRSRAVSTSHVDRGSSKEASSFGAQSVEHQQQKMAASNRQSPAVV